MTLRIKLLLLMCSLFVAAISNAVFTLQLESYSQEKLDWVNHTNSILDESNLLLSNLKDAETGQRGFLLTKVAAYLQPYYTGLENVEIHFNQLKRLTTDNLEQQKRLDSIKEQMDLKFAELDETINLTQTNDNNIAALKLVTSNKGKQYMDSIRRQLSDFNNAETLLLEQRKGDFKASKSIITTLMSVELVLFVFLGIITFTFLQRNLFQPMDLLLSSTKKAGKGQKITISDIVQKDEMGYLLSSFYKMSQKIQKRTGELDYKAHHDELTGLKNRVLLFSDIEDAINKASTLHSKTAIFFIDLNDFKILNDTLGHDAGDVMLKETATLLKNSIRSDDSVYRVGGDEFVVLLNNINSKKEAEQVITKMLGATQLPLIIQGKETKISLSIGAAIAPDNSNDATEIVSFADIAMYIAKRNKDPKYKFYDDSLNKRASDAAR